MGQSTYKHIQIIPKGFLSDVLNYRRQLRCSLPAVGRTWGPHRVVATGWQGAQLTDEQLQRWFITQGMQHRPQQVN